MKTICAVILFVFSLSINAHNYGILVDDAAKEIILDGSKHPKSFLAQAFPYASTRLAAELYDFATENSGFAWNRYACKNYVVKMENIQVDIFQSVNCLVWFMSHGFKVILSYSAYVKPHALEKMSYLMPQKYRDDYFDIIFNTSPSFEGKNWAEALNLKTDQKRLIDKGYTIKLDR